VRALELLEEDALVLGAGVDAVTELLEVATDLLLAHLRR
jgi:hypothetical protein